MKLWQKQCKPVDGHTPVISKREAAALMKAIPRWSLVGGRLHRPFEFPDFRAALKFVNLVGKLAESEGHHPDIAIHSWNQVRLALRTDTIRGLSGNDFILAAKIDLLPGIPS